MDLISQGERGGKSTRLNEGSWLFFFTRVNVNCFENILSEKFPDFHFLQLSVSGNVFKELIQLKIALQYQTCLEEIFVFCIIRYTCGGLRYTMCGATNACVNVIYCAKSPLKDPGSRSPSQNDKRLP